MIISKKEDNSFLILSEIIYKILLTIITQKQDMKFRISPWIQRNKNNLKKLLLETNMVFKKKRDNFFTNNQVEMMIQDLSKL
jgi:hypothetical protein